MKQITFLCVFLLDQYFDNKIHFKITEELLNNLNFHIFKVTSENGLFNFICDECANEVNKWYTFRQQIIRSLEIGHLLLKKKATLAHATKIPSRVNDFNMTSDVSPEFIPYILPENEKLANENSFCSVNNGRSREKCKICNRECDSTKSYNCHLKCHKVYACSKCDKSFKTSQVLLEHLKRHYNDRRHICTLCDHKFYARANLIDHMRSHTGEKPFKCDICGGAFGTKATLRQHQIVSFII